MQNALSSTITTLQSSDNLDTLGRSRFAMPTTLFDSKQLIDKQPLFWDDQLISGSGGASTYNTFQCSTTLSLANTTAGYRARQTFRRFNYQLGKSQLIKMSMVIGTGSSGNEKRWGLFTGKDPFTHNGIFWRQNGTTLQVGIISRANTSETIVAQSAFNLDKLDGTGASGYNINLTIIQDFIIDFQWPGFVRFGIMFGNKIIYCHQIENLNSMVYMSTPNLPLRVEIENDGSGSANSITQVSCSVISEGGVEEVGNLFSIDRGVAPLVTLVDTDLYPLIALRLKSTNLGACLDIKSLSLLSTTAVGYRWTLILNPTVTGTAFSYTGITNSAIEADVGTTNASKVSGGTVLASGYGSTTNQISLNQVFPNKISLGVNIAGTSDVLVLAVQRTAALAESFSGGINWNETI